MEEGEDGGKIAIKKHRKGGLCWGKRIVSLGGRGIRNGVMRSLVMRASSAVMSPRKG
jgi:hypothetical protein